MYNIRTDLNVKIFLVLSKEYIFHLPTLKVIP
jgi:hypothetical protein